MSFFLYSSFCSLCTPGSLIPSLDPFMVVLPTLYVAFLVVVVVVSVLICPVFLFAKVNVYIFFLSNTNHLYSVLFWVFFFHLTTYLVKYSLSVHREFYQFLKNSCLYSILFCGWILVDSIILLWIGREVVSNIWYDKSQLWMILCIYFWFIEMHPEDKLLVKGILGQMTYAYLMVFFLFFFSINLRLYCVPWILGFMFLIFS